MPALVVLTICLAQAPAAGAEPAGWLWPGCPGGACDRTEPYVPHEGDVVLITSVKLRMTLSYALARSGHPFHAGLIVRRCDGSLAILESGGDVRFTTLRPVLDRFVNHKLSHTGSTIWVRRIQRPLTPAESARLTCFAESQVGKPFAAPAQLAALAFPRLAERTADPTHSTWYCSEVVVGGLVASGLIPPGSVPGVVLPRDIYFDSGPSLRCGWGPPARWSFDPAQPPVGGPLGAPR
jgi:hypothetical protein